MKILRKSPRKSTDLEEYIILEPKNNFQLQKFEKLERVEIPTLPIFFDTLDPGKPVHGRSEQRAAPGAGYFYIVGEIKRNLSKKCLMTSLDGMIF